MLVAWAEKPYIHIHSCRRNLFASDSSASAFFLVVKCYRVLAKPRAAWFCSSFSVLVWRARSSALNLGIYCCRVLLHLAFDKLEAENRMVLRH